ncbi:hypothetical protein DdX_16740 [Ditylenchus destructor]|uniref:Uncharacterized protein n=1 Tax=Ditylenchus destructor TaxID=166010 RepID=A0AAD4QZP0_9BILA|nr:hypothetical protein DdX_16740 [Ditylenchus destructor]
MLDTFLTGFSGTAGIVAAFTFIAEHQQFTVWMYNNLTLPRRAHHHFGYVVALGLCLSAGTLSAIVVMDSLGPSHYLFPMDQPIQRWNGTVVQRALFLGTGIPVATVAFYYTILLLACIAIDILRVILHGNNGNNQNPP